MWDFTVISDVKTNKAGTEMGKTASDQSKLGLRDRGHVFGFHLKWVGECLRVLSREGPDLISRLEALSCCEGDRL